MTTSPQGDGTGEAGGRPTQVCHRHPDRYGPVRCQRCDRPICPDCMIPASVGFQCPDCVREGAKTVRSTRTSFGGQVPADATRTSIGLIAVNVVVWLLVQATGGAGSRLVDLFALSLRGVCSDGLRAFAVSAATCSSSGGGLSYSPGVADGAVWELLTSMFTHVAVLHVGFNMLALYFVGPQLEMVLGRARFLAVYLVSGFAGGVLVLWTAGPYTSVIGASGSIFGLLGALVVVFVRRRLPLNGLMVWIGLNAVFTVIGPNISWQAHLGGFVGGLATMAVLVYAPRQRRTAMQAVGVKALVALLVLATAARIVLA